MSQNGKHRKWSGADKLRIVLGAMQPGVEAMSRKPPDCAGAESVYTRALDVYPDKSIVSYELARALSCEKKLSAAVYEFQRAALNDPKVSAFADSSYVKVHGSDEGLEQLKQLVRQSALPPADFKIRTAAEIADEKRAEFEKSNPQLALWMKIKGALSDTGGEQYFESELKDSAVPQLRGVLIEATPACRPRELTVAVPLPGTQQTLRPEIRLQLDKPLAGKPGLNQEFHWEGVPSAFTRDPFLLTMATSVAKIEGLKMAPCAAAPAKGVKTAGCATAPAAVAKAGTCATAPARK